jgi:dihydrofolate reductase
MKLTMTTFLSLDGVMQGPGGPDEDRSNGFEQGGWLVPYVDVDMGKFVAEWFAAADAFLLGRKTYEIFAGYWPKVTDQNDPVATKLNSLPKYVVSNSLDHVEWNNSRLIKGDDVVGGITRLKHSPGRELQVHGSGDLGQTLIAHDLIDQYRLWVYPVVLGNGMRLFREGVTPAALKLVDTKSTSTGVAIHVYEPAGKPRYGSIPAGA